MVLGGEERPLFNQNELIHMRDVKGLVRGVYAVQLITGVYLLGYVVAVLAFSGGKSLRKIAGQIIRPEVMAELLTIAMVGALGIASLVGFDFLFEQFHVISFSNELWRLDPRENYLTRLFTQGFFLDATILVAGSVIVQALLLMALGWIVRRFVARRQTAQTAA